MTGSNPSSTATPDLNAKQPWVLIFPGQGSQEIGMGNSLWEEPSLADFKNSLLKVAPENLDAIRKNGPLDQLNSNKYSSACIFITSMLAFKLLERKSISVSEVLGYSVGQYSALAAAGVLTESEALTLVIKRAELMDRESAKKKQGMLAVLGLDRTKIESILAEINHQGSEIYLSNLNAQLHFTVAGDLAALEKAETLFKQARAFKTQQIAVSGAWHSPFMQKALPDFEKILETVSFKKPQFPVIDNVTGQPFEINSLPKQLAKHLHSPVCWHDSLLGCLSRGNKNFIEVGHGNLLAKMLTFVDRRAKVINVLDFIKDSDQQTA